MNSKQFQWQKIIVIAVISCSLVFILNGIFANPRKSLSTDLPSNKIHPLPNFLAEWKDETLSGDYFNQIDQSPLGYLVWSQFPVKIFVQKSPKVISEPTAAELRYQQWVKTVKEAIVEWQAYFPLQEIADKKAADIIVLRSQPKRAVRFNPQTDLYDIPRAITAETKFEFYLKRNPVAIAHKMKIQISPSYTGISLLATARHELGHALGIWGHSLNQQDALYFSQVPKPLEISPRDINTLKKIYQHPTRLGWKITKNK